MNSFFQKFIDQGLFYMDDILILAHIKTHKLDLTEQLHQICSSSTLKNAPEKPFYILLTVTIFGHGKITVKLIQHQFDGLHKLSTPTSKTELIRFIGPMNFYSNFIHKLHISLKYFFTLFHDDTSFERSPETDKPFNEIRTSLSKNAELAILTTRLFSTLLLTFLSLV